MMRREQSRRDWRRVVRIHSQGCRINDKIDLGKLRAQYCFVPRNRFETRHGTKHARCGKVGPQPLRKRLCFFVSTIDKDKAFTILERALPGNCMARSATRSKDHHPQIAKIDREFGADRSQESFPVGVRSDEFSISKSDCVYSACASRGFICLVDLRERRNFVRHSQVYSDEIELAKKAECGSYFIGPNMEARILHVDLVSA